MKEKINVKVEVCKLFERKIIVNVEVCKLFKRKNYRHRLLTLTIIHRKIINLVRLLEMARILIDISVVND